MEPCKFEDKLIRGFESIARIEEKVTSMDRRINGSYQRIKDHVDAGDQWRKVIVSASVGLVVSIIGFAYWCGRLDTRGLENKAQIQKIETQLER